MFAVETVAGQLIKEEADYLGVRVTFQASLENAHVPMQIDIGFGDTVVPDAAFADYPTIPDHAQPRLRAYPKETVVAEKFEAMVKLGQLNSRLKDFFDLWLLSRQFEFDGRLLSEAIARTFENRKTAMSAVPIALTATFANDPIKQTQWKGFLRKSRLEIASADFPVVVAALGQFLGPLAAALVTGKEQNSGASSKLVTPRSSPAFSSSWMRAPAGSNGFTSLALSFAECVSTESTSLSSSLCLRYAAACGHTS